MIVMIYLWINDEIMMNLDLDAEQQRVCQILAKSDQTITVTNKANYSKVKKNNQM